VYDVWTTDFVSRLENEEGFKFCIHHRDFEVGETISGNALNDKLIISKDDNTEAGNDVSLMIFIWFELRSSIFRDVMLPNISYPFPHPVILFPYTRCGSSIGYDELM
jgi:hypothetical protein